MSFIAGNGLFYFRGQLKPHFDYLNFGWYFWDYDGSEVIGPYPSEWQAKGEMIRLGVNRCDCIDKCERSGPNFFCPYLPSFIEGHEKTCQKLMKMNSQRRVG